MIALPVLLAVIFNEELVNVVHPLLVIVSVCGLCVVLMSVAVALFDMSSLPRAPGKPGPVQEKLPPLSVVVVHSVVPVWPTALTLAPMIGLPLTAPFTWPE